MRRLVDKGVTFLLFLVIWLDDMTTGEGRKERINSFLWKKNVKKGELCDNPVSYHLGRGSLINPL